MLHILGWVAAGIGAYFSIGSATVLVTAYLQRRVTGKQWFGPDIIDRYNSQQNKTRWLSSQECDNQIAPAWYFWLWPLIIPISVGVFVVSGFFTATERIGDRLIATADNQRKRIGAYRENPQ